MEEMEGTVAAAEPENGAAAQQPADDAREAEVSAWDVMESLNAGGERGAETVEHDGDDGQGAQDANRQEGEQKDREGDKFSRRIAAALRSQEQKLIGELGRGRLNRAQIAEVISEHLARQMHEQDPEISVKAAKQILDAQRQEQSAQTSASEEQVADVKSLLADGWTREELLAFAQDPAAQEEMSGGRSVRQAALSYLRRGGAQKQPAGRGKSGAPIARSTSAGGTPEMDPIKNMTGAQYDRFMEDLRRRAMRGEKVRI